MPLSLLLSGSDYLVLPGLRRRRNDLFVSDMQAMSREIVMEHECSLPEYPSAH